MVSSSRHVRQKLSSSSPDAKDDESQTVLPENYVVECGGKVDELAERNLLRASSHVGGQLTSSSYP